MKEKIELLAPAGNMECLEAAVQNGADAVYFAGQNFGARSYADNFDEDAVIRAAEYCHLYSAAAYVTVNTAVFDREFKQLERFVKTLAKAKVDGVIVQDLGVIRTIRTICPNLPLHGSTQMTVHNLDGVSEAEKMGLSRVVLSRELSLNEIEHIIKNCSAEIEVFVHGAMCMSYSGQCLMSSVLGGRSGNRGRCAQPCRLAYDGHGGERHYLSLKDMSLISHLDELKKIGVASLKIEGRMKGAEYVASVVRAYRKCLDEMRLPNQEEEIRLESVFYRGGLTDGYFTGDTGRGMFAFDKPDNPYARHKEMQSADEERRKILLSAEVCVREGKPVTAVAGNDDFEIKTEGTFLPEPAKQRGIDEDEIKRQLMKTGGTPFEFKELTVNTEEGLFVPVRELNEIRRRIFAEAEKKIMDKYPELSCGVYPKRQKYEKQKFLGYTCAVRCEEQFFAAAEFDFRFIYVPLEILAENPEKFLKEAARIVIMPAAVCKDEPGGLLKNRLDKLRRMGFNRLAAENIGDLCYRENFVLHGGHRLNLFNERAMEEYKEAGLYTGCLSPELNLAQIRDISGCLPKEMIVYGHLPLMVTENCILNNIGECPKDTKNGIKKCAAESCPGGKLKDRKNMIFPVIRDGKACRSVVLNALPTYMGDKKDELKALGVSYMRLCFTVETAEECRKICSDYLNDVPCKIREYTRLHFYKGVQ